MMVFEALNSTSITKLHSLAKTVVCDFEKGGIADAVICLCLCGYRNVLASTVVSGSVRGDGRASSPCFCTFTFIKAFGDWRGYAHVELELSHAGASFSESSRQPDDVVTGNGYAASNILDCAQCNRADRSYVHGYTGAGRGGTCCAF